MKKITFIVLMMVVAKITTAQPAANMQGAATVQDINKVVSFKNAEYSLGKITFGKPVEYVVEIKNISKDTVTLINVQAGCGCTTPNFTPNEKLAPGQTGKVTIHFNGGTMGPFTKASTVFFSGNMSKQLTFSGEGIQETAPAATTPAATENAKIQKNLK